MIIALDRATVIGDARTPRRDRAEVAPDSRMVARGVV
jgi:hypothetical protein